MSISNIQNRYTQVDYDPPVVEVSEGEQPLFQNTYKFRSPYHFFKYVEDLHTNYERRANNNASDTNNSDFCLTTSLQDAFEKLPKITFTKDENASTVANIKKLIGSSRITEEGYEVSIPDYLSGSEHHFIQHTSRRTQTNVHTQPFFILCTYNAMSDAETMKENGLRLLNTLYNNNILVTKPIACFATQNAYEGQTQDSVIFVDLDYRNPDQIAQILHPSSFRRLTFRLEEQHPNLSLGYGQTADFTKNIPVTISACSESGVMKQIKKQIPHLQLQHKDNKEEDTTYELRIGSSGMFRVIPE